MSDTVRKVGEVDDAGGYPLAVGACRRSVIIGDADLQKGISWALDAKQVEELAQLIVRASWEAARQDGPP